MKKIAAISFMLAASFSFAVAATLVKGLGEYIFGDGVNPFQIAYARFFFAFIFLTSIVIFTNKPIESLNKRLHFLRSLFGWLGVSILFTAILYIPISDATALTFLNPIFAMIFAVLLFKESVGVIRWFAALISFLGGLILIRPTLDLNVDPVAVLCLFGAVIMGLEIICIKILSSKEKILNILLFNNFFATCIGTLFLPFFFEITTILEITVLIFISFFMLFGQFCFINSVKRADTSFLMPFFYTTLIFVILLDLVIYNSLPDKTSYLGASIIIFGSLVVTFREWQLKKENLINH